MMLYLDSVDAKEISFMLDYIYQGEVKKKVKCQSTKNILTDLLKLLQNSNYME